MTEIKLTFSPEGSSRLSSCDSAVPSAHAYALLPLRNNVPTIAIFHSLYVSSSRVPLLTILPSPSSGRRTGEGCCGCGRRRINGGEAPRGCCCSNARENVNHTAACASNCSHGQASRRSRRSRTIRATHRDSGKRNHKTIHGATKAANFTESCRSTAASLHNDIFHSSKACSSTYSTDATTECWCSKACSCTCSTDATTECWCRSRQAGEHNTVKAGTSTLCE